MLAESPNKHFVPIEHEVTRPCSPAATQPATDETAWVLSQVYPETSTPRHRRLDTSKLVVGRGVGAKGWRLADPEASRRHATIRFVRSVGVYRIDDEESLNGTFVDGERCAHGYLRPGSIVRIGSTLFTLSRTTPPWRSGTAPAICESHALADRVASHRLPVLITGQTGVGKERLARRIHERSGRTGAFVPVNCGALPQGLIGSELFGHAAGAYSGASGARDGLFVKADGGTLLLDEIAELPLELQPVLLRTLQERTVRAVGADDERAVDVRVIAATHADLDQLAAEGKFREDLLARIRGMTIRVPPLSERRTEVLPLFRRFVDDPTVRVERCAAEALLMHAWPQNVRELVHAAQAAAILMDEDRRIDASCLPPAVRRTAFAPPGPPSRDRLVATLQSHEGNIARVCRTFDCHRQQVYRWMKAYGIESDAYRGRGR